MLDEKAKQQFRDWGALGGKAKARKYTSKQISAMAKRKRAKRRNGAPR